MGYLVKILLCHHCLCNNDYSSVVNPLSTNILTKLTLKKPQQAK